MDIHATWLMYPIEAQRRATALTQEPVINQLNDTAAIAAKERAVPLLTWCTARGRESLNLALHRHPAGDGAQQRSHVAHGIIAVLATQDSKHADNPEHLGLLARSHLTRTWARALGADERREREMPFAVVEDLGEANAFAPALGRSRSPPVVPLLEHLHRLQPPRRAP